MFISEDPTDMSIIYDWFNIGVLDYDFSKKLFLVQKTVNGRIVDKDGNPVVNGGLTEDG